MVKRYLPLPRVHPHRDRPVDPGHHNPVTGLACEDSSTSRKSRAFDSKTLPCLALGNGVVPELGQPQSEHMGPAAD